MKLTKTENLSIDIIFMIKKNHVFQKPLLSHLDDDKEYYSIK
jgi:hypothetical protein